MTEYERIKHHFESTAVCRHKQKPELQWDGIPYIECNLGDKCKCRCHDGEGEAISKLLARWMEAHSA